MTDTPIERLKGLLAKATEPRPAPLPEQDSRVGEAGAARQDDTNYRLWRERTEAARMEIIDLLLDEETIERAAGGGGQAYREALEEIANPIKFMQQRAEAEGVRLSGMAYSIANSVSHLQAIARQALSTIEPIPSPGEGERAKAFEALIRYHETGGHEGDPDVVLANAKAALALPSEPLPASQEEIEGRARALAAEIMVAVRQARFPREYAAEAHDEFEALTLKPMLIRALSSKEEGRS